VSKKPDDEQDVLDVLDEIARPLSRVEYCDLLKLLIEELRLRLETVENDDE
jgi:hypothetical protein